MSPASTLPAFTVGLVIFVASIPMQFVYHGLPAFLRQAGHPPETVSIVFFALIPYALRFFWAPALDKFGSTAFGRRKSWIVPAQFASAVALAGLLLTDPAKDIGAILAAVMLLMCAVATCATATDAFMLERIPESDRHTGPTAQAVGSALSGLVLGLGLYVFLGERGWQASVAAIAILTAVAACIILMMPMDHGLPAIDRNKGDPPAPTVTMFSRRSIRRFLLAIICLRVGVDLPFGLTGTIQVDAGLSIAEIGLYGIVLGNLAGMAAATIGGAALPRLGARKALMLALALTAVGYAAIAAALQTGPGRTLAVALTLLQGALPFLLFVVLRTFMLELADPRRAATEMAALTCIDAALILLIAGLSGTVAAAIGFAATFAVAAGLVLAAAPIVLRLLTPEPAAPPVHAPLVPVIVPGDRP
jgi:MFS transporter (putative signal transducer)